jgi:hypothetical protein
MCKEKSSSEKKVKPSHEKGSQENRAASVTSSEGAALGKKEDSPEGTECPGPLRPTKCEFCGDRPLTDAIPSDWYVWFQLDRLCCACPDCMREQVARKDKERAGWAKTSIVSLLLTLTVACGGVVSESGPDGMGGAGGEAASTGCDGTSNVETGELDKRCWCLANRPAEECEWGTK